MVRVGLIISAVLLAATGCSDASGDTKSAGAPEPTAAGDETTTTTTLSPETTTTPETATSAARATTTTIETTATTTTAISAPAEGLAFETLSGTAPAEFTSYTASMTITMAIDEFPITAVADGVWTTDAFECTMSSELSGITFSESIIGTPQTLWYDQGNGYEETGLFDSSAGSIMSSCPASPVFWSDITTDELGFIDGTETTFNGRSATQADLTELLGALSGLGLTGVDDDFVQSMTVWIDVETDTVIGMQASLEMPAELLGGLAEEGYVTMAMDFALDNFNDPTLSIELP
jgi:hypothetical protein